MQHKKPTRAYKMGYTDGLIGGNKNYFTDGSTRAADYERGFNTALDDKKNGSVSC